MENLLNQGVGLALFGMVTVFSFLTLLILATRLMSFLVSRIDAEQEAPLVNKEPLHITYRENILKFKSHYPKLVGSQASYEH